MSCPLQYKKAELSLAGEQGVIPSAARKISYIVSQASFNNSNAIWRGTQRFLKPLWLGNFS
ncbi:MAG: hypothetical protein Fur006_03830 [Coleofasciculaceae cyanobacterium]